MFALTSLYEGAAVWQDLKSVSGIVDSSFEHTVSTVPFTQVGNELLFAEPTRMEVYSVSGAMVYSGIVPWWNALQDDWVLWGI